MTTKAQEIKALEQIRKIINGLGEDSYIGTAFEGCFEIAAQNIDMDAAFSMKGERDLAEKQVRELKQVRDELVEENEQLTKRAEDAERLYNQEQGIADSLRARLHEAEESGTKCWNAFREQEEKVGELEQEIIKLKAKLYDLMMGA